MIPDIAVIGGGVIGLSCAWRLAQGGARVELHERSQVGKEASWAAAGMLAPACELAIHGSHLAPAERAAFGSLMRCSRDLYTAFAAELLEETGVDVELSLKGAPGDWRQPGILYVETNPEALQSEAARTLLRQGVAGHLGPRQTVLLEEDGQVESRKLVEALRKAVLQAGVVIKEGSLVRQILTRHGSVNGVITDQETYMAGGVLLAAGAWSGKLAGTGKTLSVPVRPVAGQVVALRAEKRLTSVLYSQGCYLVPRRDGRLLIGATVEENGFHKRVTAGGVADLINRACALVPELATAPLESHWAGLRPVTTDTLPIMGPGQYDNFWLATGHGRNGILLTPGTAHCIADGILRQGAWPEAFASDRFGLTTVADDKDPGKRGK